MHVFQKQTVANIIYTLSCSIITETFSSVNTTDGYWFLTVAGDESTQLTIKVYDPATGETITVQQTLTYTDDATLGLSCFVAYISLFC